MTRSMRRLRASLAVAAWIALAVSVPAQTGTDPRCATMKDPIGCTCALATGGAISGSTWARGRGDDRVAYDACVSDRGGQGRPKPQTIPGRRP